MNLRKARASRNAVSSRLARRVWPTKNTSCARFRFSGHSHDDKPKHSHSHGDGKPCTEDHSHSHSHGEKKESHGELHCLFFISPRCTHRLVLGLRPPLRLLLSTTHFRSRVKWPDAPLVNHTAATHRRCAGHSHDEKPKHSHSHGDGKPCTEDHGARRRDASLPRPALIPTPCCEALPETACLPLCARSLACGEEGALPLARPRAQPHLALPRPRVQVRGSLAPLRGLFALAALAAA